MPNPNFFILLSGLDRAFAAQLARIKGIVAPKSHALGQRKPDLEHTEARLMRGSEDLLEVGDDEK